MATGENAAKAARTATLTIFSSPVSDWKLANWRGFHGFFGIKPIDFLDFRLYGGEIGTRTLVTLPASTPALAFACIIQLTPCRHQTSAAIRPICRFVLACDNTDRQRACTIHL